MSEWNSLFTIVIVTVVIVMGNIVALIANKGTRDVCSCSPA